MSEKENYRPCVRLVIVKGNKIVLSTRTFMGEKDVTVPGGGIEKGKTPEEACREEALEEVGMEVVDVVPLDIEHKYLWKKPDERDGVNYVGGNDTWFMAKYKKKNMSKFNIEGDGLNPKFVSFDEAREMISQITPSEFSYIKLEAIAKVEKLVGSEKTNALESW